MWRCSRLPNARSMRCSQSCRGPAPYAPVADCRAPGDRSAWRRHHHGGAGRLAARGMRRRDDHPHPRRHRLADGCLAVSRAARLSRRRWRRRRRLRPASIAVGAALALVGTDTAPGRGARRRRLPDGRQRAPDGGALPAAAADRRCEQSGPSSTTNCTRTRSPERVGGRRRTAGSVSGWTILRLTSRAWRGPRGCSGSARSRSLGQSRGGVAAGRAAGARDGRGVVVDVLVAASHPGVTRAVARPRGTGTEMAPLYSQDRTRHRRPDRPRRPRARSADPNRAGAVPIYGVSRITVRRAVERLSPPRG